jgi:hypothetical protein
MKPIKISVFAVPSHVVFRPSGNPIRIRNEGRSLAESQREWLHRRLVKHLGPNRFNQQCLLASRIMTSENQPLFAGPNVDLFCHSPLHVQRGALAIGPSFQGFGGQGVARW